MLNLPDDFNKYLEKPESGKVSYINKEMSTKPDLSQLTQEQQELIDKSSEIPYSVGNGKKKTVRAFYDGKDVWLLFNRIWGLSFTQRLVSLGDIACIFGGDGNIIYVNVFDKGLTVEQGNVADEDKHLLSALEAIANNKFITLSWVREHAEDILESFDSPRFIDQEGFKWVYENGHLYIDHPTITNPGRTCINYIRTFYELTEGKTTIDIAESAEPNAEVFGVTFGLPFHTVMEILEDISKRFKAEHKERLVTLRRIQVIIQQKKEEAKEKESISDFIKANPSGMWTVEADGSLEAVPLKEQNETSTPDNASIHGIGNVMFHDFAGDNILYGEEAVAKFASQVTNEFEKKAKSVFLDGQIALNTYKWLDNRLYVKIHTTDTIAIIDILAIDHLWYDGEQTWLYAFVDPYKGGTVITRYMLNETTESFLERLLGARDELENCDSPLHNKIDNRISHVIESFATIHEAYSRFVEETTIIDGWEIPETSFDHLSVAEEDNEEPEP